MFFDDITHVSSDHVYLEIFLLSGKKYLVREKLDDFSKKLPQHEFVRIHRRHVVNISHIQKIGADEINIANETLPISRSCKPYLKDLFKAN